MRSDGWWGGRGLGGREDSIVEPIAAEPSTLARGAGIGFNPTSRASRSQRELKAILSLDDTTTHFGYTHTIKGTEFIQLTNLNEFGRPTDPPNPRSPNLRRADHSRACAPLWWNRGAIGIAESTYPHPKGWSYYETHNATPLDKLKVSDLTAAHRRHLSAPPPCQDKWEQILGMGELPWMEIWNRLWHPLLTNQDSKNNSRVIFRSIRTRSWDTPGCACRLCGKAEDRLSHLGSCEVLQSIFEFFEDDVSPSMIYLGVNRKGRSLEGSDAILYTCLWKYTLAAYTKVDTDDAEFDVEWVMAEALKRAFTRIEAHAYKLKLKLKEYSNTGREVPPNLINNYSKSIQPAARFDASGRLEVSEGFLNTAKQVGYYTKGPTPNVFTQYGVTPDATEQLNYRLTRHYNPSATAKLNNIWQDQELKYERLREEQITNIKRIRRRRGRK